MSQGLVVQGANPAALFPGVPGATLSQRALMAMQGRSGPSELAQGITGGFGIVSYKGKVWHIKHGGEDTIIKQRDERGMETAVQYIEVVIVGAAGHLTKTWYEKQYVEGSVEAPDCTSSNGVIPEPASPKKQAELCATCKWNQYGSRVSADGRGRGKACQDNKRLAVVPYADMENEANGGPMLLRIPPASLQNLQKFAGLMERNGYPFYGVSVYLFFVGEEAYPQIDFKPARPLSDDEFAFIEGLRKDDRTLRVLNSSDAVAAPAQEAPAPQPLFGGPPGGGMAGTAANLPQQPTPMHTGPAPAPVQAPQQMPPVTPVTPTPAPTPMQPAPAVNTDYTGQLPAQAPPPVVQAAPVAAPPAPVAPAPQPQPATVQAAPVASETPSVSEAPGGGADINDFLDNLGGM